MSRYIDADLIEKELTENGFYELDKIPTADVVEVVHAKILNPNPYGLCSNCNNLIDIRDEFNYCPKCGAMLKTDEVTE